MIARMRAHPPAAAFAALAVALTSIAALPAQEPSARKGYAHQDGGFAGTFADLLSTVELQSDGKRVVGTCDRGGPWQLDGTIANGVLTGTATALVAKAPFTARFDQGRLLLQIGDLESPFARVLPLDARLAELGDPVVDPERKWTIAVYLGGDNDLEDYAIDDLVELQQAGPVNGVDVVVLLDRLEHQQQGDGVWSDTRVFHLSRETKGEMELLAKPGELDTGAGVTLASFLTGAFRKYPAEHRAVVVWDHGGGWTGVVSDRNAPGTEHGTDMLDLQDIRLALQTAQVRTSMTRRFDLLLFDACLMAHLETAVAVMDGAEWLVASQASVPGTGCPYGGVLPLFADNTDAGAIARGIVGAFGAFYEHEHDSTVTLSAIELARVPAIAAHLDRFAEALAPALDQNWAALGRALFYGESYQPRTKRATGRWVASLDLRDALRRVRDQVRPFPAAAANALADLERELDRAVVATHRGEQRALSHGLSVYAPYRETSRMQPYARTALGAGNRWTTLLAKLHALARAEAAPVTIDDVVVHGTAVGDRQTVQPFHGDAVTFAVTGRGLCDIEQWDLVADGEQWVVLRKNLVLDRLWPRRLATAVADEADRLIPVFADGRNELSVELLGMQYLIDNRGESFRRATIDLSAPSSQAPFVVQAELTEPGQPPIDVEVHFDRAWWRATGVYPLHCDADELEARRIVPTAASSFRFALETIAADGTAGRALGEPMTWDQGLWLVLSRDEPGDYRALLRARTLDGRSAAAQADFTLVASADLEAWSASWQAFDRERLVGDWPQSEVTGPEQFRATAMVARFVEPDPMGPGVFRVETRLGKDGADGVTHQTWVFEQRGVPNLRVITEIADGRTFCWYGPAVWGMQDERPFVAMKALNVSGVLWRWQQSIVSSLLQPTKK